MASFHQHGLQYEIDINVNDISVTDIGVKKERLCGTPHMISGYKV